MVTKEWTCQGNTIHAAPEMISSYGYAAGERNVEDKGSFVGNIYAYVMIEFE